MKEQELKEEVWMILNDVSNLDSGVGEGQDEILSLLTTDTLLALLKEKIGYSIMTLEKPQAVCKECNKLWYECECPVKMYVKEEDLNK